MKESVRDRERECVIERQSVCVCERERERGSERGSDALDGTRRVRVCEREIDTRVRVRERCV